MLGSKTVNAFPGAREGDRAVVRLGVARPGDRPSLLAAAPGLPYTTRPLPVSLRPSSVPPWVRELSRLLARLPPGRHRFGNLQMVEEVLRTPGGRLTDLPDAVLWAAGQELRRLARRDTPTPALARLLDQFEAQVVQPAQHRLRTTEQPRR